MNGEELEYTKEVKYLGIKLNHKLNRAGTHPWIGSSTARG